MKCKCASFTCSLSQTDAHKPRQYIPAPKVRLPGHDESYNPPPEYLPTKEEVRLEKGKELCSGKIDDPNMVHSQNRAPFFAEGDK